MTKNALIAAMAGLPGDTHIEIHVPAGEHTRDADYEIASAGVVTGTDNPPWFNISVGEFITECG